MLCFTAFENAAGDAPKIAESSIHAPFFRSIERTIATGRRSRCCFDNGIIDLSFLSHTKSSMNWIKKTRPFWV